MVNGSRIKPLSRVCECDVCEELALTNQTVLPDGWVTLWETSAMLCDKCLQRYIDRWGEEPAIWLRAQDKELDLFKELIDSEYSSIS